jgi:ABC-type glycerol-3-phosphate transport system substrate-binding protein
MAQQKLALPLDDRIKGWDARNDFIKSAWDSGFDGGKQYGLPLFVTARVVYLRKAILTETNVTKTPETWEELVDTAKRATKVETDRVTRQGFTSPAGDGWWYFFWLLQTTGATLLKDGKAGFVAGGEGETVLQFMKDLQLAIAPTGAEPLGGGDAANFTNGTVPHAWLHLSPFKEIEKSNAKDYREMVISTPQVPGNTQYRTPGGKKPPLTFVDNALNFISTQTKYPDHVWELMKLLLDGETLLEFNNLRGRLVPRKSLFNQGYMKEEKVQQIAQVYEKYGRARFNPPNFDGVTRAINATIATAVKEQKLSAREAANAIARDLEQIATEAGYKGTTRS